MSGNVRKRATVTGQLRDVSYSVKAVQAGMDLARVSEVRVGKLLLHVDGFAAPPRSTLGQAIDDGVQAAVAEIERASR